MTADQMTEPAAPADEQLLTVPEIAGLLRVDEEWVRKRIRAGDLTGHRLGREWRVPRWSYRAYLANTLVPPAESAAVA